MKDSAGGDRRISSFLFGSARKQTTKVHLFVLDSAKSVDTEEAAEQTYLFSLCVLSQFASGNLWLVCVLTFVCSVKRQ